MHLNTVGRFEQVVLFVVEDGNNTNTLPVGSDCGAHTRHVMSPEQTT